MTHREPEPEQFTPWPGHPLASWLLSNASDGKGPISRVVLFTAVPAIVFAFVVGLTHGSGLRNYKGPTWNAFLLGAAVAIIAVDAIAWRIRLWTRKCPDNSPSG